MTNWPFADLQPASYDIIVCDPPWLFKTFSAKGEGKSPQAHYACMSLADIQALPVGALASPNCYLFLWTSAPLLDRAVDSLRTWGFKYKSRLSWRKTTVNGKVRVGPGFIVRTMHEDILVGSIGKPRGEHSRKPDEFYDRIQKFSPDARRADLFARQSRPGFSTWGNESTRFDTEAA